METGRLNQDANGLSWQFEGSEPGQSLKAVINTCSVPENEPLLVKNFAVTCTMHVHGLDDLIPQDLLSHLHLLHSFIAT